MIGLLRAIFDALNRVLAGQKAAALQATNFQQDVAREFVAQAAAIEHLRVLIESDSIPTEVGTPTFTPTGGPE